MENQEWICNTKLVKIFKKGVYDWSRNRYKPPVNEEDRKYYNIGWDFVYEPITEIEFEDIDWDKI